MFAPGNHDPQQQAKVRESTNDEHNCRGKECVFDELRRGDAVGLPGISVGTGSEADLHGDPREEQRGGQPEWSSVAK